MKFVEQKFNINKEEIKKILEARPNQKVLVKDMFNGLIYGELVEGSFDKASYKIKELDDSNPIHELRYRNLMQLFTILE